VDTSRISFGEMVAAISGALLLIFMFFPWYGAKASGSVLGSSFNVSSSESANAWQAFGFIDILLFVVAITAIGLGLMRALGQQVNLPQPAGLIIAAAGAIAVLLILYRLIDTPGNTDINVPGVSVDVTRKIGAFLGLLAAAGVAIGGWLAMNESPAAAPAPTAGSPPPPAPGPPAGPPPPGAPGGP
jgi:hypothetical protein